MQVIMTFIFSCFLFFFPLKYKLFLIIYCNYFHFYILFQVKASFDFDPQYPEELQLRKGEIITVLEKKDENWWRGENAHGQQGLFPATYVSDI